LSPSPTLALASEAAVCCIGGVTVSPPLLVIMTAVSRNDSLGVTCGRFAPPVGVTGVPAFSAVIVLMAVSRKASGGFVAAVEGLGVSSCFFVSTAGFWEVLISVSRNESGGFVNVGGLGVGVGCFLSVVSTAVFKKEPRVMVDGWDCAPPLPRLTVTLSVERKESDRGVGATDSVPPLSGGPVRAPPATVSIVGFRNEPGGGVEAGGSTRPPLPWTEPVVSRPVGPAVALPPTGAVGVPPLPPPDGPAVALPPLAAPALALPPTGVAGALALWETNADDKAACRGRSRSGSSTPTDSLAGFQP
jgi:hypothetical protein